MLGARDVQELEDARQDVETFGANVLAIPCDVTERDQVRALIAAVLDRFARINILINNAGTIVVGPARDAAR